MGYDQKKLELLHNIAKMSRAQNCTLDSLKECICGINESLKQANEKQENFNELFKTLIESLGNIKPPKEEDENNCVEGAWEDKHENDTPPTELDSESIPETGDDSELTPEIEDEEPIAEFEPKTDGYNVNVDMLSVGEIEVEDGKGWYVEIPLEISKLLGVNKGFVKFNDSNIVDVHNMFEVFKPGRIKLPFGEQVSVTENLTVGHTWSDRDGIADKNWLLGQYSKDGQTWKDIKFHFNVD